MSDERFNLDDDEEMRAKWLAAEESAVWLEEQDDDPPAEPLKADSEGVTEILGSEKQYQAHIFDVSKLSVRLPNGKVRNYDLVEHVPAVVIIPVTDDGDILFVRQFRMGANQELLETPAGILNGAGGAEDPLEAALRECREECGYEAKSMERAGGIYMTPGYCTEYIHIYLARDLVWNPLPQDDDEFLHTEKIPIEEAYRLAESGQMNDAKTVAALLMVQSKIRKPSV